MEALKPCPASASDPMIGKCSSCGERVREYIPGDWQHDDGTAFCSGNHITVNASDIARAVIAGMEQPRNCGTCCWDRKGTDNCMSCDCTNSSWTPRTVILNPSDVAAMTDKLGEVL